MLIKFELPLSHEKIMRVILCYRFHYLMINPFDWLCLWVQRVNNLKLYSLWTYIYVLKNKNKQVKVLTHNFWKTIIKKETLRPTNKHVKFVSRLYGMRSPSQLIQLLSTISQQCKGASSLFFNQCMIYYDEKSTN